QLAMPRLIFQKGWQKTLSKHLKKRRISEKPGHVNKQIVKERFDFAFVVTHKARVLAELFHSMKRHAALDPPGKGAQLVAAKVDAHLFFEREKNAIKIVRFFVLRLCRLIRLTIGHHPADVGMIDDMTNLARDLAW